MVWGVHRPGQGMCIYSAGLILPHRVVCKFGVAGPSPAEGPAQGSPRGWWGLAFVFTAPIQWCMVTGWAVGGGEIEVTESRFCYWQKETPLAKIRNNGVRGQSCFNRSCTGHKGGRCFV